MVERHITVCWAQIKQVGNRQSRDYQNMMGDTTLDHYHHIWKSYQIGSSMKIFKKQIFILHLIFSYENSSTYEQLSVKKKSKVFIGGAIFISCLIFSYENSATYEHFWFFSHSIVHRWSCFHMKIWDIKWKFVFWKVFFKNQIFHFIPHIFIWKQLHLWTLLIFSHSIVHRWHCFHMKIWDIKWKFAFLKIFIHDPI